MQQEAADRAAPDAAAARQLPPPTVAPEAARTAEALLRSAARLLDTEDETELLARYGQSLVAQLPELKLVWAWFGPADTPFIKPMVYAGAASDYARRLVIPRNEHSVKAPAFRALAGERVVVLDMQDFGRVGPWADDLRTAGIRNLLALPLRSSADEQRGMINLYADEDGWFQRVGLGLFDALAELYSAVFSRAARNAAMARAATRDALTGLLNRHALPQLAQRLVRYGPEDPPATLVMLDLDHFKHINDTHGHAAGDQVLQGVSQSLLACLRRSDTCMRWGGEEFLVVLQGSDLTPSLGVLEGLRERLAALQHALPGGPVLQVTASMGVAALQVGEPLQAALERADRALYAAKHGGRNRIVAG